MGIRKLEDGEWEEGYFILLKEYNIKKKSDLAKDDKRSHQIQDVFNKQFQSSINFHIPATEIAPNNANEKLFEKKKRRKASNFLLQKII